MGVGPVGTEKITQKATAALAGDVSARFSPPQPLYLCFGLVFTQPESGALHQTVTAPPAQIFPESVQFHHGFSPWLIQKIGTCSGSGKVEPQFAPNTGGQMKIISNFIEKLPCYQADIATITVVDALYS